MMVTRWGLSEPLGTIAYGENQDEVFLGCSVTRQQNISQATAEKIDTEIRRLLEEAQQEAARILSEKRYDLEVLAKGLLEYETLSGDEIANLLSGTRLVREETNTPITRPFTVPTVRKAQSLSDTCDCDPRAIG
jgi:cell division protease FtsH